VANQFCDVASLSWELIETSKSANAAPKVTASKLKPKRIYAPRIISDHIMVQEDFERLYKFLLETECLPEVSDDSESLIENEWPELVHKLPPKATKR
jgi:hypothetical protein